jgi:hypothetical protein
VKRGEERRGEMSVLREVEDEGVQIAKEEVEMRRFR